MGTGDHGAIFLLIAAPEPTTPHADPRPPVEVFTSERTAREAFVRRRLEVGSGSAWAQLVAVEDQAVRPLCWFGRSPGPLPASRRRTQHAPRRWAVRALALSIAAVGWVSAGISDRAIVDPASHSFQVQDVDTGRTSVVVPAHPGRST